MTSAEWPFAPNPGAAGTGSSTTLAAQLIVLAKAPVPGRVKTRLTPPFTPQEAAMLAEAALVDTLEAGASAYLAKPIEPDRLVRMLHSILSGQTTKARPHGN